MVRGCAGRALYSASADEHIEEIDAESQALVAQAREDAETLGVPIETHTIVSHRLFDELLDAARTYWADLVVMGWGPDAHSRAETGLDELTETMPCDFLVLKDRGFDPQRILVPTAGGPDSELSAHVASLLRAEYDAEVTLLHVADDRDEGEQLLATWADDNGLGDATLRLETGDVEIAIEDAATDATMVVIGATERGPFSRLVTGSLVTDVVEDVECSVLLAEKTHDRSLFEHPFGR